MGNIEETNKNGDKKVLISTKQFSMLIITFIIATADVFVPAFVAQEAKADAWISVILGTISALIIANIIITLGLRYPDKTIIEYSCDILGKWLGKVVGALYVYFFLAISWLVVRELEEILVIAFSSEAPDFLYGIVVVLVAAYAVFSGLEVIARINEILLPIGLIILIFIAVINIPYLDLTKLLPILYDGFAPSLKGTLFIQTWMLEIVVFLQILPYIKNKKKIRISMNISIGFLGISLQVGVMTIAVFGVALTGKLLFPALDYVRYAKLGHYIQNLDISIMIVWISGIFIKIAFSYFAGTLALAQLFGLKSYRKIIIPVGIIIVVFSTVTGRTLTDILFVLKYILPFYFLFMAMVLPCLLLLVSFLREGKKS